MHEKPKAKEPKRYADMDYNELTIIFNQNNGPDGDPKIKLDVMKMMRSWLRNQEMAMTEEARAEKAETEKQKRILKETGDNLKATRKIFLEKYGVMNKFITSKYAVLNIEKFEESIAEFNKSSAMFTVALNAHTDKLREAQDGDSPLTITKDENIGA